MNKLLELCAIEILYIYIYIHVCIYIYIYTYMYIYFSSLSNIIIPDHSSF